MFIFIADKNVIIGAPFTRKYYFTTSNFKIFNVDGLLFPDLLIKLIIITTAIKFHNFIFYLISFIMTIVVVSHAHYAASLKENKLHLLFPRKHIYCYSSYCVWKKKQSYSYQLLKRI